MRAKTSIPPDLSKAPRELCCRIYPELAGRRLDQALAKLLPWRSRSSIQRLIKQGSVLICAAGQGSPQAWGEVARASRRVHAEDVVIVKIPERLLREAPNDATCGLDLEILFEDPYLLGVNKRSGMAVHPSGRRLTGTLINLLHARYRNKDDPGRDIVPRLCHRLDRETSGLVLVAKDALAHSKLRKQFEAQTIAKSYLALVEGHVAREEAWIDLALGPAQRSKVRLKMELRQGGLESLTHYEVLQRGKELSLLRCRPRTGRQHQIRVHLAAIGHPIVGDKLYGPDENYFLAAMEDRLDKDAVTSLRLGRQALHSESLRFVHPESNEELCLTAVMPEDMGALLASDLAAMR